MVIYAGRSGMTETNQGGKTKHSTQETRNYCNNMKPQMTQQENTLHRGRNLTRRYKKARRG